MKEERLAGASKVRLTSMDLILGTVGTMDGF